jgi:hypothetical protein
MTDSHPSYGRVGKPFASHGMTDHRAGECALPDGTHTNTVEGVFSLLKRGIYRTFHSVSRKHLHRYLSEFDIRYNNRFIDDGARTAKAIRQADGLDRQSARLLDPGDSMRELLSMAISRSRTASRSSARRARCSSDRFSVTRFRLSIRSCRMMVRSSVLLASSLATSRQDRLPASDARRQFDIREQHGMRGIERVAAAAASLATCGGSDWDRASGVIGCVAPFPLSLIS